MKKVWIVFIVFALVGFAVTALAQAPVKPPKLVVDAKSLNAAEMVVMPGPGTKGVPTLDEVNKLKIQNVLLRIELAQRQAQQAQTDFEKARADAQTLIQGLQVPDYELDLQTFTYRPKVAEPVVKK